MLIQMDVKRWLYLLLERTSLRAMLIQMDVKRGSDLKS